MDSYINAVVDAKNEHAAAYAVVKEKTQALEQAKAELRSKLDELHLKSAKTDRANVAIVRKNKMVVENEAQVKQWLENEPNIESDLYVRLDKRALEELLKEWSKQTGEIVSGIAYEQTEYMSIKETKA